MIVSPKTYGPFISGQITIPAFRFSGHRRTVDLPSTGTWPKGKAVIGEHVARFLWNRACNAVSEIVSLFSLSSGVSV